MNGYYIIIGAAAFQGLLLAIALKKIANNKKSLSWLSALLVAISLCLVGRIFYDERLFPKYPKIAFASDLILFTYGPLIYWYVKSVFYKEEESKGNVLRHFILSIVHLMWLCQFFFVSNAELFRKLFSPVHQTIGHLTEILGWIHITVYLLATYRIFNKYPGRAKAMVSALPTINFFRYFFILNTIALIFWATGFFLRQVDSSIITILLTYNSIWILLTGSVYMTGYYAIAFPQVFRIQSNVVTDFTETENAERQQTFIHLRETSSEKNVATFIKETETGRTESVTIEIKESKKETTLIIKDKPALTNIQHEAFAKKLENFMEQEKPYLNPDLTLPMLSGKLSCTVHLLSKVINESFGKNFFDYINGYRVQYFMQLAKQPANDRYTILSLAFESGFNSKSTFNNSFKKITGKTPSKYLNGLSQNNGSSK